MDAAMQAEIITEFSQVFVAFYPLMVATHNANLKISSQKIL